MNLACVPLRDSSAYGGKKALLRMEGRLSLLRALVRQGPREERGRGLFRGAAGWLCPVPVSDSRSIGYRLLLERVTNDRSMN